MQVLDGVLLLAGGVLWSNMQGSVVEGYESLGVGWPLSAAALARKSWRGRLWWKIGRQLGLINSGVV
jgi:hypothetical protein